MARRNRTTLAEAKTAIARSRALGSADTPGAQAAQSFSLPLRAIPSRGCNRGIASATPFPPAEQAT